MYLSKMDKWLERNQKIIWILFIAVEYLLFKSFAEREVVNYAPLAYDQSVYLKNAYDIFGYIKDGQVSTALAYMNEAITSSAMSLVSFIPLIFGGYSRLSLLTINFLFWIAMQLCGYKAIAKIGGQEITGWGFVGLTLLMKTPYSIYGGMYDFRWDFAAFCMYTIWFTLLLLWIHYDHGKYMYMSAIASGILVFVRFYYALFVAITVLLLYVCKLVGKKVSLGEAIKKVLIYGGICILSGGWSLILFAKNLIAYQSLSNESGNTSLWNIEGTIKDFACAYFGNLYMEHIGKTLFMVIFLGIIVLIAALPTYKKRGLKLIKSEYVCLVVGVLLASAVLIINGSQNQAVISINLGAYLLLIFYFTVIIFKPLTNRERVNKVYSFVIVCLFIMGASNYVINSVQEYGYGREEDIAVNRINEAVASYLNDNGISEAKILTDTFSDVINKEVVCVYMQEKHQKKVDGGIQMLDQDDHTISYLSDMEIYEKLEACNILIISKTGYTKESIYPINAAVSEHREQIIQYANDNMTSILTTSYNGGEVFVFVKSAPPKISGYQDGWLGKENNFLKFTKENERQKKIILRGTCGYTKYDTLKLYIEDFEQYADVWIDENSGTYECEIDISELELGEYFVTFSFTESFVPYEINGSSDMRNLVIMEPNSIEIYASSVYPTLVGYEDGWLGIDGNTLSFTKTKETQQEVTLSGNCAYTGFDNLQMKIEELNEVVNVNIDETYWTYSIVIDISDLPVGEYEWNISFNQAFIPSEENESSTDTRQLVIQIPTEAIIR